MLQRGKGGRFIQKRPTCRERFIIFSCTIIVSTPLCRTLRVHRHVRTPCAMLQFVLLLSFFCFFLMYRTTRPPAGAEHRSRGRGSSIRAGSTIGPGSQILGLSGTVPGPLGPAGARDRGKNLHCISVFDYTTQRFRAPAAKEQPGPAITKFYCIPPRNQQ